MSYQFSITIPVRPHIKKMIASSKEVDPFVLSQGKCFYSQIILNNLEKSFIKVKDHNGKDLTEEMTLIIPNDLAKQNRFYLSHKTMTNIDKGLIGVFEDKLNDFLALNCAGKGDIRKYIKMFLDFHKITEDDVLFESVVKQFWRYRKKYPEKDSINFRALSTHHSNQPKTGVQGELSL